MKSKIGMLVIGLVIVSMLLITVPIKNTQADSTPWWTCSWTANPTTGYYNEAVIFTGTSNCPDPVSWGWNFGDGTYGTGNPVTHYFKPNWESPKTYNVALTVTNTTGKHTGYTHSYTVITEYDLTGVATASPILASKGATIQIAITAHNNLGHHICPVDYNVHVEIWKVLGGYQGDLDDLTGAEDISPGNDGSELYTSYYAYQVGVYYAKVYFDTTYDQHTQNNIINSNLFTIV